MRCGRDCAASWDPLCSVHQRNRRGRGSAGAPRANGCGACGGRPRGIHTGRFASLKRRAEIAGDRPWIAEETFRAFCMGRPGLRPGGRPDRDGHRAADHLPRPEGRLGRADRQDAAGLYGHRLRGAARASR
ncbi:hypothetical protein MICRO8M_80453 [Microbacterium sp. 8M]|nr:hypothetical protein MICRO8M_80453 [Microbacterium sp. 8M]